MRVYGNFAISDRPGNNSAGGITPGAFPQSNRLSIAMGYWALSFSKALRVTW